MQPYDVLMLAVLVAATLWGAYKGLAWQIASIGSLAASYLVALRLREPLAGYLPAEAPWNIFLAMLILFVGTGTIVWLMFNVISEFIEQLRLQAFDRQLGALFGAAKGALLCALITLFGVTLLGESQRQAICNSRSGYYIALLLDRAEPLIPRELHEVLAPYLDQFERSVPHPHTAGRTAPGRPGEPPRPASSPGANTPGTTPGHPRSLLPPALRRWLGLPAPAEQPQPGGPPPSVDPGPALPAGPAGGWSLGWEPAGGPQPPSTYPAAPPPGRPPPGWPPSTSAPVPPTGSFPTEEQAPASPLGAATPWRPPDSGRR